VAAPNQSTFDLVPPRRIGKGDFNGIAKVDDENEPPDPTIMPNAAEWNTMEYLIIALCRVLPVAVLSITNTGTPTLTSYITAPTGPTSETFTITKTGVGNILISWPANTFPVYAAQPVATLNAGPGMINTIVEGNGVRIHTYNSAGSAADLSFTVTCY